MPHKKTKILTTLFFIFLIQFFCQISFSKYVIEDTQTIAKLDIDRTKPTIELLDIISSNTDYPTYANQTHLITGHIKITEKNIIRNDLSSTTLKVAVGNRYYILEKDYITPEFKSFFLLSENSTEKIYEFSFTHAVGNGALVLTIPEGTIEDKSGLVNEKINLTPSFTIDNTPPKCTFEESSGSNGKSIAELFPAEPIRPLEGWNGSAFWLTKEFSNPVSYSLPIVDFAQNASEVLISIQNPTAISIEYGTYDACSLYRFTSNGKIPAPNTISSNSLCKAEAIFIKLADTINANSLEGRSYVHTYWGDGSKAVCYYSNLYYSHGYSKWLNLSSENIIYWGEKLFSQLGGVGSNSVNATSVDSYVPIPNDIAKQYLYGISGIQFRLKDTSNFSVVYQSYVKDIGWLKASADGEESFYRHDKPISSFRINLVPKSEKQYLIDFWNRDIGTNHID